MRRLIILLAIVCPLLLVGATGCEQRSKEATTFCSLQTLKAIQQLPH